MRRTKIWNEQKDEEEINKNKLKKKNSKDEENSSNIFHSKIFYVFKNFPHNNILCFFK